MSMHFSILAMPTFFLISGYLFFFQKGGVVAKIKSRVTRLLFPCLIWNIIAVAVFLLIWSIVPAKCGIVNKLQLNTWQGVGRQIALLGTLANGPLWYLRCLFVFCLLSPFLMLLYRWVNAIVLCVVFVLSVVLLPEIVSPCYPVYGFALFTLGGLAAHQNVRLADVICHYRGVFLVVAGIALILGFAVNYAQGDMGVASGVFRFFGAPMFIVLASYASRLFNHVIVAKYIAPAGFMIYTGHGIFNSMTMHTLGMLFPPVFGRMWIVSILTMVVNIMLCVAMWHLLNRFAPNFLSILDGRGLKLRN